MITSVVAAFCASGGLNAGTPLEIASTPVMAVQPLANARRTRKIVRRARRPAPRPAPPATSAGTPPVK